MSNLRKTMAQINQIRARCPALIGNDCTMFLLETVGMQSMADELRGAWKTSYGAHLSAPIRDTAEDRWLEYTTKCQVMTLRHMYDHHMIVNENRTAAMPFVVMALAHMDYEKAVQVVAEQHADFFIQALMLPEQKKENVQ